MASRIKGDGRAAGYCGSLKEEALRARRGRWLHEAVALGEVAGSTEQLNVLRVITATLGHRDHVVEVQIA